MNGPCYLFACWVWSGWLYLGKTFNEKHFVEGTKKKRCNMIDGVSMLNLLDSFAVYSIVFRGRVRL